MEIIKGIKRIFIPYTMQHKHDFLMGDSDEHNIKKVKEVYNIKIKEIFHINGNVQNEKRTKYIGSYIYYK